MNRARSLAPQLLIYTVLPLTLLLGVVALGEMCIRDSLSVANPTHRLIASRRITT